MQVDLLLHFFDSSASYVPRHNKDKEYATAHNTA